MPPSKNSKKAPNALAATKAATKATKAATAAATREVKKAAELETLRKWISENDPLLDNAATNPIKESELFSTILTKKSFAQPGVGQVNYDWSAFRAALAARTSSSPRWFVQLREEDLLAGDDGMDGVTVNCFVVAEVDVPTLAPAEYVVKVHWPYSDAEDNAPERILPIAGQKLCWRRVVADDGRDLNLYLLQRRDTSAASAAGGAGNVPSAASFGFGAPATASPSSSSSFSSFSSAAPAAPATGGAGGFGFSFGTAAAAPAAPASFGFGFGAAAPPAPATSSSSSGVPTGFSFNVAKTAAPAAPAVAVGVTTPAEAAAATRAAFGFSDPAAPAPVAGHQTFGFGAVATTTTAPAPAEITKEEESGAVKVEALKPSEVLFCLWSKKRLADMAHEVKSGSRIVREKFPLDATHSIKLVMENDRKDRVASTVRNLILNRLFAKQDEDVMEVDKWISDCPVYDEALTTALQQFRAQHVNEIADESDEFARLYNACHGKMEEELQRIVDVRNRAAQTELDAIEDITERLKSHHLAEKSAFRLLKYYPKNDVQKFRPFGKVSGISEMGETVDLCEPPAHVNINPFTGKPS